MADAHPRDTPEPPVASTRRVGIVVFDGVQPLDVVGPHEVFAGANVALDALGRDDPRYELTLVGVDAGPVRTESGMHLVADHAVVGPTDPAFRPFDTIVASGGTGAVERDDRREQLVDWLTLVAPRTRRITTVCSGTFLAAAAGLCDGRRVTTHWARAGQLAAAYPAAMVEPDALFIRDGNLWTSAGVTAGIDLALALVDDDLGPTVAQLVARHLVVHVRRPGGQTQYAAPVWSEPVTAGPIAHARDLIHAEPGADLSVPTLAATTGVSERHFARLFRAQVGEAPARYVERVRVEAARGLLETSDLGLAEIARRCGFGTDETLRRAFHRRLDCSPDAYRRHVTPRPPMTTPT